MSVFIGVDGGGTTARAVVVDAEGRELGRGRYSGAVVTAAEPDDAVDAVTAAVRLATEQAHVDMPADGMWAGLAGAGGARAKQAVTRALSERGLARRVNVGTDVEAAFHDAFGEGPGVLLMAGTGSIAWARDAAGTSLRVGGWGQVLGDEGSGFSIGVEALKRLTRAEDGRGPETRMRNALLDACGVASVVDLIGWVDLATKGEVAALAPLVVTAAEDGDAVAASIVDVAVDALVAHVVTAIDRVADGGASTVLWGGLLAEGGPLRPHVVQALERIAVPVTPRSIDPAMGAARLALSASRG